MGNRELCIIEGSAQVYSIELVVSLILGFVLWVVRIKEGPSEGVLRSLFFVKNTKEKADAADAQLQTDMTPGRIASPFNQRVCAPHAI